MSAPIFSLVTIFISYDIAKKCELTSKGVNDEAEGVNLVGCLNSWWIEGTIPCGPRYNDCGSEIIGVERNNMKD